jgi:TRAP-type C4-dicarboxylate transport system substrate-binding protein
MRHRAILGAFSAIAVAASLGTGSAAANEPFIIKIGSFTPPRAEFLVDITIPWLRKVEQDSGNTIKFQEYWGGQLIRAPDKQFEGMMNGIQDASQILPSYTQALFPQFSVFSLPFIFRGAGSAEGSLAAWRLYEKGLLSGLDKVYVTGVYTNDNSGLHFNREIKSISEIKGMKVRVAGPEESEVVQVLDLVPVALGTPQVPESLNRGVIQGALVGWSAINQFRITPLVKTHIDVPLGVRSFFQGINKTVFDKLPEKGKQAIAKNSGLEHSLAYGRYYERVGGGMRKNPEGRTVVTPSRAEMDELQKKFKPVHDQWIKDTPNGAAVFKALQDILAASRGST